MHYDLLAKIKNAAQARKESFLTPFSGLNISIAKVLVQTGYLRDAQKKIINKKHYIEVKLKYHDRVATISDFRIISKPGRRVYIGYRELRPVKQNFGLGILSTPQGVLTNRDARQHKVGGEYLFQIW